MTTPPPSASPDASAEEQRRLLPDDRAHAHRDTSRDSSGDDGRHCPTCHRALPSARARYCSHACRQRAFRLRQPDPVPTPDLPTLDTALRRRQARVAHTVYECPTCETRFLWARRCNECNTFCRALGLGGTCFDCDTVILLTEFLGEVLP